MKTFTEDFNYFWNRIFVEKIPTVFARYADGEAALIRGRAIGPESMVARVDGWSSPTNELTQLGLDLRTTIKRIDLNYFYAISDSCCDQPTRDFLLSIIKSKNITFANLWINGNYNTFKDKLYTIDEPLHLIVNEKGFCKKYPFKNNIDSFTPIGIDCINYWKNNKKLLIKNLQELSKDLVNPLILVAAGPMSELIVDILWSCNPIGRYIDVGSALDESVFGHKTREYMYSNSSFNNRICYNQ